MGLLLLFGDPMKVYVAGPMRGYPLFNFPAFDKATALLREQGHEVFSPAEEDASKGFDSAKGLQEQGFSLRDTMLTDLTWIIRHAEAIVCLPGWGNSKGALAEVHTAWCIGIPVYRLDDFLAGQLTEIRRGVL